MGPRDDARSVALPPEVDPVGRGHRGGDGGGAQDGAGNGGGGGGDGGRAQGGSGNGDGAQAGDGIVDRAAPFADRVAEVLRALEPGDVVTYGEVAAEAGNPGAARAVGRLLAASDGAHPWWRVVTAAGRLVPGAEDDQARRLRAEGVDVVDGRVRAWSGRRRRVTGPVEGR